MSAILRLLSPFGFGHTASHPSCTNDDIVDRLNREITVIILLVFVIVVSTKQYVGDPIHCWVPGHFTRNYECYVNKICWVSNTYYLPIDEPIPMNTPQNKMINYYQWIPMVLLVQALMFYLPCLAWKHFCSSSGIDVIDLLESSKQLRLFEQRDKLLRYICFKMDGYLRYYQPDRDTCYSKAANCINRCCCICRKRRGNYLTSCYIFVKLLYLVNLVCQLILMNFFLATDFHMLGINVLKAAIYEEDSPAIAIFPRETFCDFNIRTKGSYHRYSVQCVLPINFFNEKIYICIWFWFILVLFVTIVNTCIWILRILIPYYNKRIARNYLLSVGRIKSSNTKWFDKFTFEYMRKDGIILLRLLKMNVSGIDVADLTGVLWDNYIKKTNV